MLRARRLARWLRLVVTCLAFVLTAAPAVAASAFDQIVLVADEKAVDESGVEAASAEPRPGRVLADDPDVDAPSVEAPSVVSRRYIENCALLL